MGIGYFSRLFFASTRRVRSFVRSRASPGPAFSVIGRHRGRPGREIEAWRVCVRWDGSRREDGWRGDGDEGARTVDGDEGLET